MTARTRACVLGETGRFPLMTCEIVVTLTPAARATSAIVGGSGWVWASSSKSVCNASANRFECQPEEAKDIEEERQVADISLREVSKTYPGGTAPALDGVSLDMAPGEFMVLVGPSGCGKSTLLRIIAGLEEPDAGAVLIGGSDVTHVPPQRRGIGFVFQHYAAFKHMTVRQNVAFGLQVRKRPKDEIRAKVDELLGIVGLAGYQDRYPAQLSGGQRQRMALARALAGGPPGGLRG